MTGTPSTGLTLDVRDLLRTGKLGPVGLGLTRREVHDLLGPPDTWSNAPNMFARNATTWLYGPMELFFAADYVVGPGGEVRLYMMWCDYIPFLESRVRPGGSLTLLPWIFGGDDPVTLAQLEGGLAAESLSFERRPPAPPDRRYEELVLKSGVVLGVDDNGDGPELMCLQVRA
jgi:hypothetical protein